MKRFERISVLETVGHELGKVLVRFEGRRDSSSLDRWVFDERGRFGWWGRVRSWESRSEEVDVDDFSGVGIEDWRRERQGGREEGESDVDARRKGRDGRLEDEPGKKSTVK